MKLGFEILRMLSDQELDNHARRVIQRMEELDEMARIRPTGLPRAEYDERRVLEGHREQVEEEQRRRAERDSGSLNTATEFHEAAPELLKVLEVGNPVVLAKYLHDRSDTELDLLAANGRTVAELAERIVTFRRREHEEACGAMVHPVFRAPDRCKHDDTDRHNPVPCGKEDLDRYDDEKG